MVSLFAEFFIKIFVRGITCICCPPNIGGTKLLRSAAPGFDTDSWPSMFYEKRNCDVYEYHEHFLPGGLRTHHMKE